MMDIKWFLFPFLVILSHKILLNLDFISTLYELILLIGVLVTGICYGLARYARRFQKVHAYGLFDKAPLFLTKRVDIQGFVRELASCFFVLLFVFVFRSFLWDISYIPTGSLKPTALIGDLILIKKPAYRLSLPVVGTSLMHISTPNRGDIITFRLSHGLSKMLTKRVIGLPGDHIQYKQKYLTINGQRVNQRVLGVVQDQENHRQRTLLKSEEGLPGRKHAIYTALDEAGQVVDGIFQPTPYEQEFSVVVPQGNYFMMGDNRDNSVDSRVFGFLPYDHILGRVERVVLSWDNRASWKTPWTWVRWERLGMKLV